MRLVNRAGWTLQEMLISLILTAGVVVLTAQLALGQLRYFNGIEALIAMRAQLGQASASVGRSLWSISPAMGDITLALDSAIEFHETIGVAVVCQSQPGSVVIAQPQRDTGNALSAFADAPRIGDRMHVHYGDTVGTTWLTLHVALPPAPGPPCSTLAGVPLTWMIALREPLIVPAGAPIRIARPARFSLYRSTNNRWYLGAKDWNGELGRFNSIQPVAGPLDAYSVDAAETGLRFVFRDASGNDLTYPADPVRVASITVTSRSETDAPLRVPGLIAAANGKYADSVAVTVALRNVQ